MATRLKELGLDLQGKQREPMKGVRQEGVGPELLVGGTGWHPHEGETGRQGKQGDPRGLHSFPAQPHTQPPKLWI